MSPNHTVLNPLLNPLLSLLEQRVGLRLSSSPAQTLTAFHALADELQLSLAALLERLGNDVALLETLATQLTVPETHFFRIGPQIDALSQTVLPDLERRLLGVRPLQLWSAGCSTGEEAYTLAILAERVCSQHGQIRILGTDLHPQSLEVARRGSYRAWSFRDTPVHVRDRYFSVLTEDLAQDHSPKWQIAAKLRQIVRFDSHNLLSADWSMLGRFDLILCRNVMIYFSNTTAQHLIERLAAQLQPSGWLILGPSDPPPLPELLERCGLTVHYVSGAIIYQKQIVPPPPQATLPTLATLELAASETGMFGFVDPATLTQSQAVTPTSDFETELQLGMSALELAELPAALAFLRRAAYLEPQSALAQFLLAKTQLDSAQPDRARVALRQAQRLLQASDSGSDLQRAVAALNVMLGEP